MDNSRSQLGATALSLILALGSPLAACADTARPAMKTAPMKVNGSGVIVQYEVDGTPQAGQVTQVVLRFDGITDPAGATARLATGSGLSLAAPEANSRSLPAGAVSSWTVGVVPAADGISYLHVFTTQQGATSATSIPVQVGKTPLALPASSDLKPAPNGDKILRMRVK